ncbi:hypothetical protein JW933_08160, partial [candidate division FCPU426 bacterium]|nr:hypothetical protein [candidate division FCPU426 bacterium]
MRHAASGMSPAEKQGHARSKWGPRAVPVGLHAKRLGVGLAAGLLLLFAAFARAGEAPAFQEREKLPRGRV